MRTLADDCFTVLVETSGAHDISKLDPRVRRIMDLKCPSSGEVERNRWANISHLRATDEVKFVIGTREDYEWAKAIILEHRLDPVCPILFSWVAPLSDSQRDKVLKPVPKGFIRFPGKISWKPWWPTGCRLGSSCKCTSSFGLPMNAACDEYPT